MIRWYLFFFLLTWDDDDKFIWLTGGKMEIVCFGFFSLLNYSNHYPNESLMESHTVLAYTQADIYFRCEKRKFKATACFQVFLFFTMIIISVFQWKYNVEKRKWWKVSGVVICTEIFFYVRKKFSSVFVYVPLLQLLMLKQVKVEIKWWWGDSGFFGCDHVTCSINNVYLLTNPSTLYSPHQPFVRFFILHSSTPV